jgi:hypothetical protein
MSANPPIVGLVDRNMNDAFFARRRYIFCQLQENAMEVTETAVH